MNAALTESLNTKISAFLQPHSANDALRKSAFESFQKQGIPSAKAEEYKFMPLARLLDKNFSFSGKAEFSGKINLNDFTIAGLEADRLVFVNGKYDASLSSLTSAKGFTVLSLQEALTSNVVAKKYFSALTHADHNSFAAWNQASWMDGVFIHIEKNVTIERPIIFHHIVSSDQGEVVISHRNLIVIEHHAALTVIEKFDSLGNGNHFTNLVNEVAVDEEATFNLYTIQNDHHQRFQHTITDIHQKRSSRVNTFTFSLSGKVYRNNLQFSLDGEGIESHMYGLYLLNQDTLADNHTVVDHKKPNSFSNELYKGIMDDSSKGVFNGKIFVRPQAQKTNAFQANRNILMSDKATVNTKPQLEIWADDVKCSHGCTTGQLDEEAIFYLQSRGISKDSARAMMLYAFAGEVLDHVAHPVLKEYLDHVISDRLHKNF